MGRKKAKHQQSPEEEKIRKINAALDSDPVDVETLKDIAISSGLVNSGLRRQAWPIILNVDPHDVPHLDEESIYDHKDVDQVAKDIDRSLWRFTVGQAYLRRTKRSQLSRIVNAVLARNPELHYYQGNRRSVFGFHDIASVFLLVMESEEGAYALLDRLSKNHIRFALNSSLDSTREVLELLFPLIQSVDLGLFEYLKASQVEPFFALSWVLTWFSHGFDDLALSARLFDFFLPSHPLMPLYFGAQVILHCRDQLLKSVECEYSAIHGFLSSVPPSLPLSVVHELISHTRQLFDRCPPSLLQKNFFRGRKSPVHPFPYPWMKEIQHKKSNAKVPSQDSPPLSSVSSSSLNVSLGEEILLFILVSSLASMAFFAFR